MKSLLKYLFNTINLKKKDFQVFKSILLESEKDNTSLIKEEKHQLGKLLSVYYSLCDKYLRTEAGIDIPSSKNLLRLYKKFRNKIDNQSAIDILQTLSLYLLKEEKGEKAEKVVVELLYHFFDEMYKDTQDKEYITLFSFRPISEYSLADVINNELTLCNPTVFNDPFDTILPHWLEYSLSTLESTRGQESIEYKHQKLMNNACKYIKARAFIVALNNDIRELSQLMWAHYAKDHKGFCIKYKFNKKFFYTNFNTNTALVWKRINYVSNDFPYRKDIRLTEALITKNDIWKYENEYRILMYDPSNSDKYESIKLGEYAQISDIYLGVRCTKTDQKLVENLIKNSQINLYKMEQVPTNAFKLNCNEI